MREAKETTPIQKQEDGGSNLERAFLTQMKQLGVPTPEREYRFDPRRRWKFDFAWPAMKIAVEVQGGVFSGGRHVTGVGFTKECRKRRAANIQSWMLLEFTGEEVKSGAAAVEIAELFETLKGERG